MSEIIINKVALACDLADSIVREEWESQGFREDLLFWKDPDNPDGTIYEPEIAQPLFERYYSQFMEIIERNEFPGQIRK